MKTLNCLKLKCWNEQAVRKIARAKTPYFEFQHVSVSGFQHFFEVGRYREDA